MNTYIVSALKRSIYQLNLEKEKKENESNKKNELI